MPLKVLRHHFSKTTVLAPCPIYSDLVRIRKKLLLQKAFSQPFNPFTTYRWCLQRSSGTSNTRFFLFAQSSSYARQYHFSEAFCRYAHPNDYHVKRYFAEYDEFLTLPAE